MAAAGGCARPARPIVFAVVADVHCADKDTAGGRYYRQGLVGLKKFVEYVNNEKPAFAIELGDFIDGGPNAHAELERVLGVWAGLETQGYFVLGNHEFNGLSRNTVTEKLGLAKGYYDFSCGGRRFVVLDTQAAAICGGWDTESPQYKSAKAMLESLKQAGAANAKTHNGAIGSEQLAWLEETLADANRKGQDAVVFGHAPLVPEGAGDIAWDAGDVRRVFERAGCVRAYLCGHRHSGGYVRENGICYLTLPAMVDAPDGQCWALIRMFEDRMEVEGSGAAKTMNLFFNNGKVKRVGG